MRGDQRGGGVGLESVSSVCVEVMVAAVVDDVLSLEVGWVVSGSGVATMSKKEIYGWSVALSVSSAGLVASMIDIGAGF